MSPLPTRWILPGLILLALAALAAWSLTRPVPVSAARVERGPVRDYVEEEGRTRVVDRYVVSAPLDGRLLRVVRREGDEVAAGDLLAEIDPLALRSRVEEAEARVRALRQQVEGAGRQRPKRGEIRRSRRLEDVARQALAIAEEERTEAEAAAAQADRDLDRAQALARDDRIPPAEREAAELAQVRARQVLHAAQAACRARELEVAVARLATQVLLASAGDVDWQEAFYREQIAAVEAGLAVLRDDLRRARITSPVAGRVLRRHVESEVMVAAGTPLLEVGDTDRLEVEADLLSEDAARLRTGLPVEVFGRALGDRVIEGRLERIYPSAFTKVSSLGVEQQRVTVAVSFDPAGTGLGDGYRVDVRVVREARPDALLVPEAALFRAGDGWSVFRVEGGRARLVGVRTGLRDGRVREVLDGLAAGDEVILHPDASLEDGDRVEPRHSPAAPP